jgi:hypothetical protein
MTGRVAINIKQNMTEELEKNNAITKEEMHHPKDEWHGHIKQGMCVCVCVCGGGGGGGGGGGVGGGGGGFNTSLFTKCVRKIDCK